MIEKYKIIQPLEYKAKLKSILLEEMKFSKGYCKKMLKRIESK